MGRKNRSEPTLSADRPSGLAIGVIASLALLAILTLLAYATSFAAAFVFDDMKHIAANESIRSFWPPWVHLLRRRPVVELTLALNYAFGGLAPRGYHVFNFLVHLAAALTLFGVVRQTLLLPPTRERFARSATGYALAVALLWAVHPLNTQAVTYVIQRGESLMGLFYLLTLYAAICAITTETPRTRWVWWLVAIAACALGMGSKAVMVTAPVMVMLYDWVFVSRWKPGWLRRRWPLYLGLLLTWGVLVATGIGPGVLSTQTPGRSTVGFSFKGITPVEYLLTQPVVIVRYLQLSFWPAGQTLDYGWKPVQSLALIVPAAIVVGGLALASLVLLLRRHWTGFLGAWFFGVLLPTSSFVPIRDVIFEHRMYLSLAAVVALVVFGGQWLLRRLTRPNASQAAALGISFVVVATAALSIVTLRRNTVYESDYAVWQDTVAKAPNNARAHLSLGVAQGAASELTASLASFQRAVELDPTRGPAYTNLAKACQRLGRYADAVAAFEKAIALGEVDGRVYNSLGNCLRELGKTEEAHQAYLKALAADPDLNQARYNDANTLALLGRYDEALAQLDALLQRQNFDPYAHAMRADCLVRLDRADEAPAERRLAALQFVAQAQAAAQQGRFPLARSLLTSALRQDPENADAKTLLQRLQGAGR